MTFRTLPTRVWCHATRKFQRQTHDSTRHLGATRTKFKFLAVVIGVGLVRDSIAVAGMPTLLPTNWTKENPNPYATSDVALGPGLIDARLQAISFFIACLLASAWFVKWIWQILRRDFTWLPSPDFRRALCLTVLWGLLFVVVLTMISGARELMTPGAWRKQGWTYKLTDSLAPSIARQDSRHQRRQVLEQLRLSLLTYAAAHQGKFPDRDDASIDSNLWDIPGCPGLQFQLVPDRQATSTAELLVFEPSLNGDDRQVILTNGMLGTMRAAEIRKAISERNEP